MTCAVAARIRWQEGADEIEVDQTFVYCGGETGYTDYPLPQGREERTGDRLGLGRERQRLG